MEFCPTFDMIGDYFKNSLQGSRFRRFRNIVIGIHEDDIPAYNASGRALLEERKLLFNKEKKESQEATKLSFDWVSQGVYWEKSTKGKSINVVLMHSEHTH